MNKKNSSQILSAENYIRQRARNLPIHSCFIGEDWENSGMAQITIARKHINGNITLCSYLVDLKCLGIKDTLYQFNMPEVEFEKYKQKVNSVMPSFDCDYNLAHNIIYAGWEFAENIGFKPHKDFLSVTQFMLEEDNDDIPIIEIACGDKNGMPLYIQGPFEDKAIANQIIDRLRKNVGEGNYHFIMASGNPFDDLDDDKDWDDDDKDWDWDEEDDEEEWEDFAAYREEYLNKSTEENVNEYLRLTKYIEETDLFDDLFDEESDDVMIEKEEQFCRIKALSEILYDDLTDLSKVIELTNKWKTKFNDYTITNAAYYQMLGLPNEEDVSYEDVAYLTKESDNAKLNQYLRERWGELPFGIFLELEELPASVKRKKKLKRALSKYPDHALLKMEEMAQAIEGSARISSDLSMESIFGDRKEITSFEYEKWLIIMMLNYAMNYNLNGLESLVMWIGADSILPKSQLKMVSPILFATRISILRLYLLK